MTFDDYGQYPCVCPLCKQEHTKMIEKAHGDNPDSWRIDGKLVILCDPCRETLKKKRRLLIPNKKGVIK